MNTNNLRQKKYSRRLGITLKEKENLDASNKLVHECNVCKNTILESAYIKQKYICGICGLMERASAKKRIGFVVDSFEEFNKSIESGNPLDIKEYSKKIEVARKLNHNAKSAVITGYARISKENFVLIVMNSKFMMGSMGSVVGQKISKAFRMATKKQLPVVLFAASGGARMQEGVYSLMQMVKTSCAVEQHSQKGLLYLSILTDPTTGGVSASFAMLADIIVAEPKALICFAGPRVIEQTIRKKLPKGFQRSEWLLERGFLDDIVPRVKLKKYIHKMIYLHA